MIIPINLNEGGFQYGAQFILAKVCEKELCNDNGEIKCYLYISVFGDMYGTKITKRENPDSYKVAILDYYRFINTFEGDIIFFNDFLINSEKVSDNRTTSYYAVATYCFAQCETYERLTA